MVDRWLVVDVRSWYQYRRADRFTDQQPIAAMQKVPSLVPTEPPLFGTPNATRLVPNEVDPLAAMPSEGSVSRHQYTLQEDYNVRPTESSSSAHMASGSSRVFGLWFRYVLTHMMIRTIGLFQSDLLTLSPDFL